jgi:hypothetical protein
MKTILRSLAALEMLLIFPATLFLTAVFMRSIQPLQYEPARTAQHIVDWYSARPHLGLWMLLIAFPLAVLLIGSTALAREWRRSSALRNAASQALVILRTHAATLLIACATTVAGGILAIVGLHVLTD